jgi:hypothetical protein
MATKKAKKNWIAGATKNSGGLHRSLGVAPGKKLTKAQIAEAARKGGKIGKQARLAQTLAKMRKGK